MVVQTLINYVSIQTLRINIMGVNTQRKDPKYFNITKEVDYQYIEIEFDVDDVNQEQKLVEELQATGMVIKAEPEGTS